jgi:hypothetical protein
MARGAERGIWVSKIQTHKSELPDELEHRFADFVIHSTQLTRLFQKPLGNAMTSRKLGFIRPIFPRVGL